jgi:WD40 repeat protein
LASGSGDSTVKVWSFVDGRKPLVLQGHLSWIYSVAFSPDGKKLASGSGDSTIKIWNVQEKEEFITL